MPEVKCDRHTCHYSNSGVCTAPEIKLETQWSQGVNACCLTFEKLTEEDMEADQAEAEYQIQQENERLQAELEAEAQAQAEAELAEQESGYNGSRGI